MSNTIRSYALIRSLRSAPA